MTKHFSSQALRVIFAAGGLVFLFGTFAGCARSDANERSEDASLKSPVTAAWLADVPLSALYDSPEALATEFLSALSEKDVARLQALALTRDEFQIYVWPKLPAARPERNLPMDFVWQDLNQKSDSSLRGTYEEYGGKSFELVSLRFNGETSDYESYRVHRDARVTVIDENGRTQELDLFGSVMEWQGRYKLFSYVTD